MLFYVLINSILILAPHFFIIAVFVQNMCKDSL